MLSKGQKKRMRKALRQSGLRGPAVKAFKGMKIGQNLGKAVGSLGGAPGVALGATVGNMVDKAVNKKLKGTGVYMQGRGSYSTALNAAMAGGNGKQRHPNLSSTNRNSETGEITISRREYICSVNSTGSEEFSCTSYNINPGLVSIFKWLSQLAANYTEYHMVQLVFTYESVISPMSVSSVGSLGTIVLASNYNSGAPKFDKFAQMIEYSGAVRNVISSNIKCGIECDPRQNSNNSDLYIRSGAVPDNQDIKTYDLAKFQIGLFGIPTAYTNGTQLGLLWADYRVILRKPRLYTTLGKALSFDTFFSTTSGSLAGNPLGSAPMKSINNSIGGVWQRGTDTVSTNDTYTFPDDFAGTVQVTYYVSGTGLDGTSNDIVGFGNVKTTTGLIYQTTSGPADIQQVISSNNTDDGFRCFNINTFEVNVTNVGGSNYIEIQWRTETTISNAVFSIIQINPFSVNPVSNAVPFNS